MRAEKAGDTRDAHCHCPGMLRETPLALVPDFHGPLASLRAVARQTNTGVSVRRGASPDVGEDFRTADLRPMLVSKLPLDCEDARLELANRCKALNRRRTVRPGDLENE